MDRIVTRGIILNRTDFGEADRILTILTPDYGRIRVMAKGVRRIKSKLAGGIELFSISNITFIKGKREIDTLISTRLQTHFGNMTKNIDRTMMGYNVLKIINKSVEDNAGEEYFNLLATCLTGLDNLKLSLPIIELWLYAQLLNLAGHSPNLKTDAKGDVLNQQQRYNFDFEKICFTPSRNGLYAANDVKLLRLIFNFDSPDKLQKLKGTESAVTDCLALTRQLLNQFIRL